MVAEKVLHEVRSPVSSVIEASYAACNTINTIFDEILGLPFKVLFFIFIDRHITQLAQLSIDHSNYLLIN